MRIIYLSVLALMLVTAAHAQFINNGATVVIQSGATLKVETNFINTAGTVTNNGTLEVTGNFQNDATFTSGSSSLVKFNGNAGSTAKTNGAVFNDVEMAKTSADVTLTDAMTINGNLSFTGTASKIVLGSNDLTMPNTDPLESIVSGAGANGYVVTNGSGAFVKGIDANGTKNMEVGDMSNYSPVSNVVTGSAYTGATIRARAYISGLQPKYAETTDYINREWNVVANGITNYENTMTGTFNPALAPTGDRDGNLMFIKGATYHSNPTPDWRFDGSSGNGSNTVTASTTTDDVKFSGKNFFGKTNLKAFLQGAYIGGNAMSTFLNPGLLPLISPYGDGSSVSDGFFIANPTIVDWVQLELRNPVSPGAPTGYTASAFIKSDGTIVGLDGSSLPRIKNGFSNSVVVLNHRNHLPIRTIDAGLNVVNPTLHDFSLGLSEAFNNPLILTNFSMENLGSGVFGLFRGNVNGNSVLNVIDLTLAKAGTNPSQSNVYSNSDVNLNGVTNVIDLTLVKTATNPSKSAHL